MGNACARAAAIWVALHLLLLLGLSLRVVRQRWKHRVQIGDGGEPELTRAIRAFGNASEYVPAGLAALVALAVVQANALVIDAVGGLLLSGRLAHAFGLSRSTAPTRARAIGMLLTWLSYVAAAAALLIYAVR